MIRPDTPSWQEAVEKIRRFDRICLLPLPFEPETRLKMLMEWVANAYPLDSTHAGRRNEYMTFVLTLIQACFEDDNGKEEEEQATV